jgi:DNA polymerase-3 subunit epsilon
MSVFAVVDIETTGGSLHAGSRITEVAVVVHDGVTVINRFSSLVNPGIAIPKFITHLTGITDEMVHAAPPFSAIAEELAMLFENKIFVAHNVSFDLGHIKSEFQRCGITFETERLCTCQLSRKIFPGFGSYALNALTKNLGIKMERHHRAMSDAIASSQILDRLIAAQGLDVIKNYSLPVEKEMDVPIQLIEKLPEKKGIYFFHDKEGNLIYVGKANNIRKRVVSHFKKGSSFKTKKIKSLLHAITYQETGSELLAYLLELEQIKTKQPFLNRAGKQSPYYGIYDYTNEKNMLAFHIQSLDENPSHALQTFKSKKSATTYLLDKSREHRLCFCINGLEKSKGSCLFVQTKSCNGAMHNLESPEDYNERAKKFYASFTDTMPAMMLVDEGRVPEEHSVIAYFKGKIGFSFLTADQQLSVDEVLCNLKFLPADVEFKRIFQSFYKRKKYKKLIPIVTQNDDDFNAYN